jgi:hypothetical protein
MSTFQDKRKQYLREACAVIDTELAHIDSIKIFLVPYFGRSTPSNSQPFEILDSWLFQGNWKHANDSVILESLSITHIINVTDRVLSDQSLQVKMVARLNYRNLFVRQMHFSIHVINKTVECWYIVSVVYLVLQQLF